MVLTNNRTIMNLEKEILAIAVPDSEYDDAGQMRGVFYVEDIAMLIGKAKQNERERLIAMIDETEAPDCVDDMCEYIHEGYFLAVDDIVNIIKKLK